MTEEKNRSQLILRDSKRLFQRFYLKDLSFFKGLDEHHIL